MADRIQLTNQEIEKLGFKKIVEGQRLGKSSFSDVAVYTHYRLKLVNETELVYRDGVVVITRFAGCTVYNAKALKYRYVSSVINLIKALQGDNKIEREQNENE